MRDELIQWLLGSGEPWTRYRTLVDLLSRPEDDPDAQSARAEMLAHPRVQAMIAEAAAWPGYPLQRHNDAAHPIYKLSTLADFGVRASDPGMGAAVDAVLAHQSPEGAFQTPVNISPKYGGTGEDTWAWQACDAPTLLYALLAMGVDDARVRQAAEHLASLVQDNGWRCCVAPQLGKFRGPGRKDDPCPIANVYALKALALVPDLRDGPAARAGVEMLLSHWQHRRERKFYLFGMGTDFAKLKYPFVWYDILHVADVLRRCPFAWPDARLAEMREVIAAQADVEGRYTAGSMYRSWADWSFGDKKRPSPWLTFLALRIAQTWEFLTAELAERAETRI
jgi:hypothetical protein